MMIAEAMDMPKTKALKGAYYFDPDHPLGQSLSYERAWNLLKQNPWLEYKVENDQVYVLSNGAELSLIVPKDRDLPEHYPSKGASLVKPAFRWLGLALLGLPPAGLGTLVFAPLAVWHVWQISRRAPLDQADRVRVAVILIVAAGLLGLALALNYLLFLHL
jgi:hypothetical protein